MAPESLSFKSHIWIQHNPHFQRDIVDRRTLLDFVKKLPLFYNGTGVNQVGKVLLCHFIAPKMYSDTNLLGQIKK